MGLVMMIGVTIITYTIYKRNIVLDKEFTNSTQQSKCDIKSLKIPNTPKSASLDETKLIMLTEEDLVLIYDICTGKLLNKIKLDVQQ